VENRVPMVKADVGFDSAIIDARGCIIEHQITPKPEQAVLVADVPLGPANAPAIRLGDWIGWLAPFLTCCSMFAYKQTHS